MNKTLLENIAINFDQVAEKVKQTILALFNRIEALVKENTALRQDNQHLRDEINRLKGEPGKPNIKPNQNISSEKERKNKEKTVHKKRPKNQHLKIDRTEIGAVDKSQLPGDAEFKGYKAVMVQGLKIQRDNVKFKKESYYSASAKKTSIADVPLGYEGGFSPDIKALALIFKNICNLSESKILDFFHYAEVDLSAGTISNMLKDKDEFHLWAYYDKLLAFKNSPSPERADELSAEFDQLFSTATGYNDLDQRILKTRAKKDELLLVLKYPEILLHNNAAELAARVMARQRDVSLHTMIKEGTKANDTFLSLVETCKKLGVNPFEYLFDRISKKYQLPALAERIRSISKNNLPLAID